MFALIKDGVVSKYPYTFTDMRRDNPQVSFPDVVSDETMADFGAQRVFFTPQPVASASQKVVELPPVFNTETQRWDQVWQVVAQSEAEIQAQAAAVRADRNQMLAECDWTQLPDAPVPQLPWAQYRQALRDITSQPGFPSDVQWPDAPA